MKECYICGKPRSEEHHIIYRKQCKPLERCKKNIVYLCGEHHRGTCGVHGKHGEALNNKLKLEFQEWLESEFTQEQYKLEDIQKILGISDNAIKSLSKLMTQYRGQYKREDIIIVCMGGKRVD
jgi:hypothetical protein